MVVVRLWMVVVGWKGMRMLLRVHHPHPLPHLKVGQEGVEVWEVGWVGEVEWVKLLRWVGQIGRVR